MHSSGMNAAENLAVHQIKRALPGGRLPLRHAVVMRSVVRAGALCRRRMALRLPAGMGQRMGQRALLRSKQQGNQRKAQAD